MARSSSKWKPLWHFLLDIVGGCVVFVCVALAALALGMFLKWLERYGAGMVHPLILEVLAYLEYFLFFVDGLLFVAYVVRSAKSLWGTICKHT